MLQGAMEDHTGMLRPGTWARIPIGFRHQPAAHGEGALLLVREGDVRP